jgi:hypothetical protein
MEDTRFATTTGRIELGRFIAQYELFKKILHIKGSIVECGVHYGSGVMAYAKVSEILEPYGFLRSIYGFDTFDGFPSVHAHDLGGAGAVATVGRLRPDRDVYADLQQRIAEFDKTRLIAPNKKVHLIKGDAIQTIPAFIKSNPHVLVALLYLDFDLYEPTKVAIREFLPRMPKGSIIAFDELNDPKYPGETQALLETLNLNNYRLESFSFEPHISWITL